ncbi:MAG: hypothetical protein ACM3PE_06850 [Deltaproteobacteria bacterium]
MQIIEAINEAQKLIFDYNVSTLPNRVMELMAATIEQPAFDITDGAKLVRFNKIMEACLQAMQNQDYLLLADVMEYELKPLLY